MIDESLDKCSEATLKIVACEHSIVTETVVSPNYNKNLIASPNLLSDGGISF
jgi:hypothetical protein